MPRKRSKKLTMPPDATEWQRLIFQFVEDHPEIPVTKWAEASGDVSEGTIRKALTKPNYGMSNQIFTKLSDGAFALTGRRLVPEGADNVPLVGRIGAGAVVQMFNGDVAQGPNEFVRRPLGMKSIDPLAALEIEGDSMKPLKAGWLVYYRRDHDGITSDEMDQLCVVRLRDGRVYLKELRYSAKPGRFDLHSWNGDTIFDQDVEWAAKVQSIVPR